MKKYEFIPSPNMTVIPNSRSIEAIIMHYTAGGSLESSVKWLCNKNSKVSAHYIIDRNGKIVQLVKDENVAWHAGSVTTKVSLNGRLGVNSYSIGIELCNWGLLEKRNEKFFCWPRRASSKTTTYPEWTLPYTGSTPVLMKEKYWEPYSNLQIDAAINLCANLVTKYNIKLNWIAGHETVDPTRKIDPGPCFPWEYFIKKITEKTTMIICEPQDSIA